MHLIQFCPNYLLVYKGSLKHPAQQRDGNTPCDTHRTTWSITWQIALVITGLSHMWDMSFGQFTEASSYPQTKINRHRNQTANLSKVYKLVELQNRHGINIKKEHNTK